MTYELTYSYKSANGADIVKKVTGLELAAGLQMCKTLESLADSGYTLLSMVAEGGQI